MKAISFQLVIRLSFYAIITQFPDALHTAGAEVAYLGADHNLTKTAQTSSPILHAFQIRLSH